LDQVTNYHFDWGTTTAYGQSTATQTVTDSQPGIGTATLTDLAPGTLYHYRLVADNGQASTDGQDRTFTTPATPTPAPPAGADIVLAQKAPTLTRIVRVPRVGGRYVDRDLT
ncbi:MAG: fibronectin type III domain-containing protein, partial [Pseudonocardiaceae bacterium]